MLTTGSTVDSRYTLVEDLGQGGMGSVYRATDEQTGSDVALKYCHLDEDTHRRRFSREVRSMETIDHRHVMTVLQSNTDHEPPYFTMPIASYSLKERLRNEDGGISEDEAIGVFLDICRGVQALHNSGVTHRDIKPGNVMIMNDEIVTVADMGLAKIEPRDTTTLTMTADVLGTHSYMAPEQQKPGGSRDADEKTDVYQLGKTLYEIITGENPIFIDNSTLPSGISYIVDVCTNDIPEKRYKSVGRLMDAIQNYKESKDPDRNPLAAFENALEEVTPSAEEGEYNRESLENIVEALHRFGSDPGTFIEQFDQIKDVVLRALSLKLPDQLREILTIYSDALSQEVGTYQFSYAESVANRMEVIFRGCVPIIV